MLTDPTKRLEQAAKALGFEHDDGMYVQRAEGADLLVVAYKHDGAYGSRWFKPPPPDAIPMDLLILLGTLRDEIVEEISAGRRGEIRIYARVSMDINEGVCTRTGEVHAIDIDRNEVTIKLTDGTPDRKTEDSC